MVYVRFILEYNHLVTEAYLSFSWIYSSG